MRLKLNVVAAGAAVAALALYPVLVFYGLQHLGASWVAAALIGVCSLRLLGARAAYRAAQSSSAASAPPLPVFASIAGIALAIVSLMKDRPDVMLYYPVLVNAALFLVFAHSLAYPPTLIERLARLKDSALPEKAIAYTRRATIAWTIFFACNGAAALYTTVAASREMWMLYNGFIAYVLIGAMFGAEFLIRAMARRRFDS